MDSPVQNEKIQNQTTNIHGYDCKIEYTEGKKHVCVDMLSGLPQRPSDSNDDNELSGPDMTDKTLKSAWLKVAILILRLAQYDHQITDNQCT